MGKRKDNPNDVRKVMASFRVSEAEYSLIKKHYGGMAGLRDAILKELESKKDSRRDKEIGESNLN